MIGIAWLPNDKAQAQTQRRTISGTVVSVSNGKPLEGATVRLKSGGLGVMTDKDGSFTLTTPTAKGTIVVTFIGYQTQEIAFGPDTPMSITIKLELKGNELEEVQVSTGYQTISPERFVGSATKLDSSSFARRAGMGIIERLKGTVTGVQFGKETNSTVQNLPMVRGISTLSSGAMSPLVVVDNFPIDERFDLSSINANDVLDVTILKDAAAASIWGALAGNGVIVITTKKGQFNQPFQISVSSNVGITQQPDLYYYPRMKVPEVIDVERFLFGKGFYDANLANTTTRPIISPVVELLDKVRKGQLDEATANAQIATLGQQDIRRDMDKYMYQPGISQQHYLNLNGGNNFGRYSLSSGYNRTRPNLQGAQASDQYTIRSNNSFRLSKQLEAEAGIVLSRNANRAPTFPVLPGIPYTRLADGQGNHLVADRYRSAYLDTAGGGKLLDWHYRPLDEVGQSDNQTIDQYVNLNVAATYNVLDWLKASVRYQYQQQADHRKDYYSPDTYFTRDLINRYSQISGGNVTRKIPLGGILDVANGETESHNLRGQVDINKSWNGVHQFSGLLAAEVSQSKVPFSTNNRFYGYDDEIETYATGLDYASFFPIFQQITGYSSRIPQQVSVSSGRTNNRVSFLGNASYTYLQRYTIYTSVRRDGANAFGIKTNNKWKPLWSAGGSWDITKERYAFLEKDWISYLRLRGSFGYMGNTVGGSNGFSTIYYQLSPDEITGLPYATVGNPPNPTIRWEEVRTINIGVDFSVVQGRITGSVDNFHKKVRDIISAIPFDPTTGVEKYTVNSASLKGKGVDVNLSSHNLKGTFSWTTTLGYSYVKTIVTKLYDSKLSASDFITYGINAAEGRIAYGLSSYRWAGLDPETGDPQGYLNGQVSKDYQGIFNDSIGNQVFNGSSLPLHTGFLTNTVTYKNISLSANITFGFDYYFRKPTIEYYQLSNQWTGNIDFERRWQKPGDEAHTTVPSMNYPADNKRDQFYAYSEVNVLRGDHIRLQDVRIQYQLDKSQLKSLPIHSIQLYLYTNDLRVMLWRKDKSGLDPDFLVQSDYAAYPAPKSWTFGINVNL